jgi:chromate transporter
MSTKQKNINIDLFITFFVLGISTFGGGYAMIALIERVIVREKKWLKEEELLEILATAQAVPGTIAINSATYIGKKISGRTGAFASAAGVLLPSFLIITILYPFLIYAFNNPRLNSLFLGIQAAVVALIMSSAVNLLKKGIKDNFSKIVFAMAMILMFFTGISPIFVVLMGAFAGILLYLFGGGR